MERVALSVHPLLQRVPKVLLILQQQSRQTVSRLAGLLVGRLVTGQLDGRPISGMVVSRFVSLTVFWLVSWSVDQLVS